MTDRIKGLMVTLDRDIRDDDAESIISAILMIRGVGSVATSVTNPTDHMNRERIRLEMYDKFYEIFRQDRKGES